MTLRQPTERHGGNARFDEETIMVSKTLASLDAWLALAEEVLAEQKASGDKDSERVDRTSSTSSRSSRASPFDGARKQ